MQRCSSSFEGALVVEGLEAMRILFTLVVLSFITASASAVTALTKAGGVSTADSSGASPPLHLAIWKSDFAATPNDHLGDLPPLLSPVDSSPPMDRAGADVPQNVPVEAVPAPTAVASGMLVLGGLAAVRIIRRLRMA
jgi:hypothetical protein